MEANISHISDHDVICALNDAGFEAFYVGGCVRDALMGKESSDIDITTNARWDEAERVLADIGASVHRTGTAFGTITVIYKDARYEVTTYRRDSKDTSDHRHPSSISFTPSLSEDLGRRDFTMNAMAWHPKLGLQDPSNGRDDIERGIIRSVGSPRERFVEDALRILRACRFASQMGFAMDPETFEAALASKSLLASISSERVLSELDGFLLGAYAGNALLECVDILEYVLPELAAMKGFDQRTKFHNLDVLEHTAAALGRSQACLAVRWAILCHDMGKPASAFEDPDGTFHFYGHAQLSAQMFKGIAHRLRFPKHLSKTVFWLIGMHSRKYGTDMEGARKLLLDALGDEELASLLLEVKTADMAAHAPEYAKTAPAFQEMKGLVLELAESDEAFSISDLAIGGHDLLIAGFEEGPMIGEALSAAFEQVRSGRLKNEHEALLDFCIQALGR